MVSPVDYQVPLPTGRSLRFHELPDGIRISRDVVSQAALWREALLPAFSVLILSGCSALAASQVVQHWRAARYTPVLIFAVGLLFLLYLLWWLVRETWQNAGIVTEVAVTKGTFYWRKRTLWGENEHFWPLAEVSRAVVVNRVLKVHRHRGIRGLTGASPAGVPPAAG